MNEPPSLEQLQFHSKWKKLAFLLAKTTPESPQVPMLAEALFQLDLLAIRSYERSFTVREFEEYLSEILLLNHPLRLNPLKHPSCGSGGAVDMLKRWIDSLSGDKSRSEFQEALVVLSRMHYYRGEYDKCRSTLDQVSWPVDSVLSEPNGKPYARILYLQFLSLKVLMAELGGVPCDSMFQLQLVDLTSRASWMTQLSTSSEWRSLTEDGLYRSYFQFINRGDFSSAFKTCRVYLQCTADMPVSFRPLKKISIVRNFLNLLLIAYRSGTYVPPTPVFDTTTNDILVPQTLQEEVALVLSLYELLVTENIPFPRAGQEHNAVDIMMEEITLAYTMLSPFVPASEAVIDQVKHTEDIKRRKMEKESQKPSTDDAPKKRRVPTFKSALSFRTWKSERNENKRQEEQADENIAPVSPWPLMLQATYRATRHTARSKQWHRQIALLSCLIESVDEAAVAIRSYVESEHLLDKKDFDSLSGRLSPLDQPETPKSATSERLEHECEENIAILVEGARLMIKTQQTQNALMYAERAIDQCQEYWNTTGRLWIASAMQVLGAAYLQLGMETLEHEYYVQFQEQSVQVLREAERWDPECWKTIHCSALALALTGKTESAQSYAKHGLGLYPQHLSFWHILVLLEFLQNTKTVESKTEYQRLGRAWSMVQAAEKSWMQGRNGDSYLLKIFGDEFFSFSLLKARISEMILKAHMDNSPKGSIIQFDAHPSNIKESYGSLLKTFSRVFFPGISFSSIGGTPNDGHQDLASIVQYFTTGLQHPFPSLYTTAPPHTDSHGYVWTSVVTAIERNMPDPIHYQAHRRRCKLRWMEWCIGYMNALLHQGQFEEAKQICQFAQSVERGNADVENMLGWLALFRETSGNTPVQETLDLPFTVDPPKSKLPTVDIFSQDSSSSRWATLDDKDIQTAFEHFQAALLYDEEHIYARIGLGRCYIAMKKWEMARVHLERATRAGRVRANQDWLAWSQLSTVYRQLGEYPRAFHCASISLERQLTALPTYLRGWEVIPITPY